MTNPMPGRSRLALPNGSEGQHNKEPRIPLVELPQTVQYEDAEDPVTVPVQVNLMDVRRARPIAPRAGGSHSHTEVQYHDGTRDVFALPYPEYVQMVAHAGAPAVSNHDREYPDVEWE